MSRLRELREKRKRIGNDGRTAEKILLKDIGADATPQSGAGPSKGDGEIDDTLIEVKSTENDGIRITHKMLSKIASEASSIGKTPALVVLFTTSGRPTVDGQWVMIPKWQWQEYADGSGGSDQE